jgi:ABC-2 type transport system permease protein
MIFYATLAGLAGATVSRIEEIQEGLTLFILTNMVGVYIGIAASGILMGAGINGFVIFSFLFYHVLFFFLLLYLKNNYNNLI